MALNWQDVAQVRFQDTTQAAKNISDSLSSLGDPLQGVIDSQTEDRQNALDSAIAQQQMQAQRMSAMASGMNAQANMAEVQRKLDPDTIAMENAKTAAQTESYLASALSSKATVYDSKVKAWALGGANGPMPQPDFGNYGNNTPTSVDGGNTPISAPIPGDGTTGSIATTTQNTTPLDSVLQQYKHVNIYPSARPALTAKADESNVNHLLTNFKDSLPSSTATNEDWFNHKRDITQYLSSGGILKPDRDRIVDRYLSTHERTSQKDLITARANDITNQVRYAAGSTNAQDYQHLTRGDYIGALGEQEGGKTYLNNMKTLYDISFTESKKGNFVHLDPNNKIASEDVTNRENYADYKAFATSIAGLPSETQTLLENRYFSETKLNKETVSTLKKARFADQTIYSKRVISDLHDMSKKYTSEQLGQLLPDLVKHGGYTDIKAAYSAVEGNLVTRVVNNIQDILRPAGSADDELTDLQLTDRIVRSETDQQTIRREAFNLGLGKTGTDTILELINTKLGVSQKQSQIANSLKLAREVLKVEEDKVVTSRKIYNEEKFNKRLVNPDLTTEPATGAILQTNDIFNQLSGHIPELNANEDLFYKVISDLNVAVDKDDLLGGLAFGINTENRYDLEFGTLKAADGDWADYSMANTNPGLLARLEDPSLFDESGKLTDKGNALAKELLYNKVKTGVGKDTTAKNSNLFRTDEETEQVSLLRVLLRYEISKRENNLTPKKQDIINLLRAGTPQ